MSNKFKRRKAQRKGYDVVMIRDFLDHLKWELRIKHFENAATKVFPVNPELFETLAKYQQAYNTFGLLPTYAAAREEDIEPLRKQIAEQTKEELEAFEACDDLLNKAIACAANGLKELIIIRKLEDDSDNDDSED